MDNNELMNRRQFFKKAAKRPAWRDVKLRVLALARAVVLAAEPFEEAKKELDDAVGKV